MKDSVIMYGISGGIRVVMNKESWQGWFGVDPSEWPEIFEHEGIRPGTMRYYGHSNCILVDAIPYFLCFLNGVDEVSLDKACGIALNRVLKFIDSQ